MRGKANCAQCSDGPHSEDKVAVVHGRRFYDPDDLCGECVATDDAWLAFFTKDGPGTDLGPLH
jgi:hypothetical protein